MPTTAEIATALRMPAAAVEKNWPIVLHELTVEGIADDLTQVAVLATIAVETGSFEPINERGTPAYFERHYGIDTPVGRRLGNLGVGDGARYHGRGFIQLTGRANYRTYGTLLDEPLEDNPDLALDPTISAKILALYCSTHHIQGKAARREWIAVRRAVNGGVNGIAPFLQAVQALLPLYGASDAQEPRPQDAAGV